MALTLWFPVEGGRELRSPQPMSRSLFAKEVHGFTILEANPTELDIRFLGTDAKVMHQFALQKAGTPVTRNAAPQHSMSSLTRNISQEPQNDALLDRFRVRLSTPTSSYVSGLV